MLADMTGDETLLEWENVSVAFRSKQRGGGARVVPALSDVSIQVAPGETLGVVGESGCGKSTLCRVALGLVRPTAGSVRYAGTDIGSSDGTSRRRLRRDVQAVFQDSMTAFNPRSRLRSALLAPLEVHHVGDGPRRLRLIEETIDSVGLDVDMLDRYPHQISGGQRQRIAIARALLLGPKLLILDEPVSSLDVAIQAQVLNLLRQLQRDLALTYVFVSHNLGVVRHLSDRVAVMYLGEVVEIGTTREVFESPQHPYTRALLDAIPSADPRRRGRATQELGELPQMVDMPTGCRFHPRCPVVMDRCSQDHPSLYRTESARAACLLYEGN